MPTSSRQRRLEILRAAGRATVLVALIAALGGIVAAVILFRPPEGSFPPVDAVREDYRQLLGRDSIPPVYDPAFVPPARAEVAPDELVMGVEIDGVARAYPVGFLNFREMVNDRIGPVPFLVTW